MAAWLALGGVGSVLAQDVAGDADEAASGKVAADAAVSNDATESLTDPGSATEAIMFYLIAAVAALSAIGCVLSVNIVRMAVCLFGALGSVAILYFLMAANFLGAIQLIVYAGGTLIVIIFGVMLTSQSPFARFVPSRTEIVAGAVVCGVLFVSLSVAIVRMDWPTATPAPVNGYSVAEMGQALLTTYLVPFELASVLLLAVMIGAAYLARPVKRQ